MAWSAQQALCYAWQLAARVQVLLLAIINKFMSSCYGRIAADLVLVTETADTPFSVISPLQRLDDGKTLYKLFSERPVRHLLHDMFADVRVIAEHKWAAYPRFAPPEQFAPFTLAPGIFYNNAWENAGGQNSDESFCLHPPESAVELVYSLP